MTTHLVEVYSGGPVLSLGLGHAFMGFQQVVPYDLDKRLGAD